MVCLVLFVCVFAVGVASQSVQQQQQAQCTSWHNCLRCDNSTIEVDMLAFLSVEEQEAAVAYFEQIRAAVELAKTFGKLHSDDLFFLHTTVQYLCCKQRKLC